MSDEGAVPESLRRWFVVHFVVDALVAVPLFVAPRAVLGLLGWEEIDVAMARVVAAARGRSAGARSSGHSPPRSSDAKGTRASRVPSR